VVHRRVHAAAHQLSVEEALLPVGDERLRRARHRAVLRDTRRPTDGRKLRVGQEERLVRLRSCSQSVPYLQVVETLAGLLSSSFRSHTVHGTNL